MVKKKEIKKIVKKEVVKKKFEEMTLEELRKKETSDGISTIENGEWKTHLKNFTVNDNIMIYSGAKYWTLKGKNRELKVM